VIKKNNLPPLLATKIRNQDKEVRKEDITIIEVAPRPHVIMWL